jgi:hypothetical protein
MSIVTYDAVRTTGAAPKSAAPKAATPKGFWSRVFDRMVEARMRQAEEYVRRHDYLLRELDRSGRRAEDSLPFVR